MSTVPKICEIAFKERKAYLDGWAFDRSIGFSRIRANIFLQYFRWALMHSPLLNTALIR